MLMPDAEGRGIAAEAARARARLGLRRARLDTLVSYIDPDNARSIRLAERLGAVVDPAAPQPRTTRRLVYRHPGPEARA